MGGNGSGRGYKKNYNSYGVTFQLGIGCDYHDNCFTCPFRDCRYTESQYRHLKAVKEIQVGTYYLKGEGY